MRPRPGTRQVLHQLRSSGGRPARRPAPTRSTSRRRRVPSSSRGPTPPSTRSTTRRRRLRRRGLADQHRGAGAAAGRPARRLRHDRAGGGHAARTAGRRRATTATPVPPLRRRGGGPGRRRGRPGPRGVRPAAAARLRARPRGLSAWAQEDDEYDAEDDEDWDDWDDDRGRRAVWVVGALVLLAALVTGAWFLGQALGDDGTADDPSAAGSADPAEEPVDHTADATAEAPRTAPSTEDVDGNPTSYDASNMLDGVPETAWRAAGDGSGLKLVFTFPEKVRISEVGLINGYAKTATDDAGKTFDWYAGTDGSRRSPGTSGWATSSGRTSRTAATCRPSRWSRSRPASSCSDRGDDAAGPGTGPPGLHRDQRGLPGRLSPSPGQDHRRRLGVGAGHVEVGDQVDRGRPDRGDRHPCRPRLPRRTPPRRGRCSTTMLVSTVAGSTPHASARSRACAWSSASRSTCVRGSSACRPAAARMPAWRIPPPSSLRRTPAPGSSRPRGPTSSEPTGAPRPLDRQTETTSATAPYSRERRPGRDGGVPEPRAVEVDGRRARRAARAGHAGPRAAAPPRRRSCACSRPDRRGRHEEVAASGASIAALDRPRVEPPARPRTRCDLVARTSAPARRARPEQDVRRGSQITSSPGRDERADGRAGWPSSPTA